MYLGTVKLGLCKGEVLPLDKSLLTLQRYLMQYLVKAPFPVGEIRPVLALLHPGHEPQDVIRLDDFEG
jgi:hypothetical protein